MTAWFIKILLDFTLSLHHHHHHSKQDKEGQVASKMLVNNPTIPPQGQSGSSAAQSRSNCLLTVHLSLLHQRSSCILETDRREQKKVKRWNVAGSMTLNNTSGLIFVPSIIHTFLPEQTSMKSNGSIGWKQLAIRAVPQPCQVHVYRMGGGVVILLCANLALITC